MLQRVSPLHVGTPASVSSRATSDHEAAPARAVRAADCVGVRSLAQGAQRSGFAARAGRGRPPPPPRPDRARDAIGAAVADNLEIPARQLRRFTTSRTSKERLIEALRLQLQLQSIKLRPSLTQLESELRDYQLPDTNVVRDSVMAFATS